MTKKVTPVNPDYADFDEIDSDAEDIIAEYRQGRVSFDELKSAIGYEAARQIQDDVYGEEGIEDLFDNPEDF